MILRLALLLLALSGTLPALAHTRSHSYARWDLGETEARVEVRVTKRDLTLLNPDQVRPTLLAHVTLEPCSALPESFAELHPTQAQRVFSWRVRCSDTPTAVHNAFLVDQIAGHAHFVTLTRSGAPLLEGVLDETHRVLPIPTHAQPSPGTTSGFVAFVLLGLEHILTGTDHLVFLLVLLLAIPRLGTVALTITGFTLGHSLTLGLAVLGWVQPDAAAVEALIGASIALLALENIWLSEGRGWGLPALAVVGALSGLAFSPIPGRVFLGLALFTACYFALLERAQKPERWRFAVAALFGLVHGFGFGGILSEMALPPNRLVSSLAGFNIGVELGQLALLALAWPLLARWRKTETGQRRVVHWGSALAMGMGCFWWISRTMG